MTTDDVTVSGTGETRRSVDAARFDALVVAIMTDAGFQEALLKVVAHFSDDTSTALAAGAAALVAMQAHSQAFAQGAEAMRQRIVQRLTDPAAWMNPPDGGDPTVAEAQRNALIAIVSLSVPPPSSPEPQKGTFVAGQIAQNLAPKGET